MPQQAIDRDRPRIDHPRIVRPSTSRKRGTAVALPPTGEVRPGIAFVLTRSKDAQASPDSRKASRYPVRVLTRGMAMAPFQMLAVDHVVLRVADLARARAFYCDVLGCAVEKWQEEFGLLQLRAGSSLIDLVTLGGKLGRMGGTPPGAEGRNLDHFCLRVAPFDEKGPRAHLATHNIDAGEIVEHYGAEGYGPSLYITDPDGNTVELKGPPHHA
jgi:catechol 2,3-dioxygenase-like lactoylglutathione lyase family enzyme